MTARTVAGWILSIVAALVFLFAGSIKLTGSAQVVTMFAQFGLPVWFVYVVGASEILGSILLLLPVRPLAGAAILCCVAVGAAFESATHGMLAFAPMAPVLAILAVSGALLRGARVRTTAPA